MSNQNVTVDPTNMFYMYGRTIDRKKTWPICAHTSEKNVIEHCDQAYEEAVRMTDAIRSGTATQEVRAEYSRFDPWRSVHSTSGEAVYFYTPLVLVACDGPRLHEEVWEVLGAEFTNQQLSSD
jgi:hypothetical protein